MAGSSAVAAVPQRLCPTCGRPTDRWDEPCATCESIADDVRADLIAEMDDLWGAGDADCGDES